MTPVAKCMARSGANQRNQIKAAIINARMNAPINTSSCVSRSRTHCNLLGIYFPHYSEVYEECIGAKKHLVLGLLSHTSDQTLFLADNRYSGGNDHRVMVMPCPPELFHQSLVDSNCRWTELQLPLAYSPVHCSRDVRPYHGDCCRCHELGR